MVVKTIRIDSQAWLGAGYAVLILAVLLLITRTKWIEREAKSGALREDEGILAVD